MNKSASTRRIYDLSLPAEMVFVQMLRVPLNILLNPNESGCYVLVSEIDWVEKLIVGQVWIA